MPQASKLSAHWHCTRLSPTTSDRRRSCRTLAYPIRTLLFPFVFVFLAASPSPAADPFAGKITAIDSGAGPRIVNILRAGKNGYAPARTGDAVFAGDTVKTGPGVRAQIELADRSLINVGADSVLQVKGHLLAPAEAKRNYVLKALKGIMRFIISNSFKPAGSGVATRWNSSSVTVETTTAVAGVRGTDFVVTSITDGPVPVTEIAVLEGVVRVRNILLSIREDVTLIGDQVTSVQQGEGPTPAAPLSPGRKSALLTATTPVQSDASGEAQSGKKGDAGKYTKGDAERDLAAGSILADVFDRAAAAGMSVDEMIQAVLDAGVNPYVVVYTAITEGFHIEAVVSASIRQGAPLNTVVLSAMMAGGEMNAVIAGAVDAGAPPEAIANAVANAETPGAPVYGYTLPVAPDVTDSITFPAAAVLVPSGATPSASPYKP